VDASEHIFFVARLENFYSEPWIVRACESDSSFFLFCGVLVVVVVALLRERDFFSLSLYFCEVD
jgi:hypothetical protein